MIEVRITVQPSAGLGAFLRQIADNVLGAFGIKNDSTLEVSWKEGIDLTRLRNRLNPHQWQALQQQIGQATIRQLQRQFAAGRDPRGAPWQPLAPSTVRRKGHSRPLIDSGKLAGSFTARIQGRSVVVGSAVRYAPSHQFGTGRVPVRQMLPDGPSNWDEVVLAAAMNYLRQL